MSYKLYTIRDHAGQDHHQWHDRSLADELHVRVAREPDGREHAAQALHLVDVEPHALREPQPLGEAAFALLLAVMVRDPVHP